MWMCEHVCASVCIYMYMLMCVDMSTQISVCVCKSLYVCLWNTCMPVPAHTCVVKETRGQNSPPPQPYSSQGTFDNSLLQVVLIPPTPGCFLGGDSRFPDQVAHRGEGV